MRVANGRKMMPSSGHRKVLKAASTRSGRAIHKMSTARRGKTPAKIANRQPISPSRRASAGHPNICEGSCFCRRRRPTDSLRVLGCHFGPSGCQGHRPEGVNRGRLACWFRDTLALGQASPADLLQGVASGVTWKLHSTLGGAEFLVDDLQRSLHRVGTEATDTFVERMVEELQEEQHRHDGTVDAVAARLFAG